MRLILVGAVAVVLAPAAALAGPAPVRHTETAPYSGPAGVQDVYRLNAYAQGERSGVVELPTRAGDRTVVLTVRDSSAAAVRVEVAQDLSGHGFVTDIGSFCSDEPPTSLTLAKGGVPLQVYVVVGMCGGQPTLPTEGKIAGVFR